MNSRQRVLTALRREQPDRVPFVEGGIDLPLQRALMGRDHYLPEDLNEVLGLDNLLIDFLPPVFGVHEVRDGINYVAQPLLLTRADLDRMLFPDPEDPALYRAGEVLVQRNRGKYAICAKMRMGVSAMLMSMGLEAFSYALVDDPGLIDTILGRYVDWTVSIVRHLRDLGVDLVWTFDDMAYRSGSMFSPRVLREVILPHVRNVAHAIKGEGFPWILHSDGNVMPLLDDLLTLGFDALHPLEPGPMNIDAVKRDYGDRLCLVGNIDLHYTLTLGTPAEVEAEVKERIQNIGKGGGYMISSANSLTSYCKVENVWAMVDAICKYANY
ncbi:MAG: uroporphyrinogen decarboxylase family protein [Caldilineaceae bacterium]